MKRYVKRWIVYGMCGFMTFGGLTALPKSPFQIEAEAHSGRTDSSGGHHDYKNKSGLGSYHYHCGGYPAHLHPNGVCPYAGTGADSESGGNGSSTSAAGGQAVETAAQTVETAASTAGWQQTLDGWQYKNSDGSLVKGGLASVDNAWYYFDQDGYMVKGWQQIGDDWYYFDTNGHMVTGAACIGEKSYYFGADGKLDQSEELSE